ncbi:MAG: phosphoadenosine phosphosulfate reductase family protein [Pseudohongiellaceae bacterium]
MASRIDGARNLMRHILAERPRPVIAFSGGVDSIVLATIAAEFGVCDAYANLSFHFPGQEAEVRQIAENIGLRLVVERRNETPEWIDENKEHLFPPPKQFITGNMNIGYYFSGEAPIKYALANGFDAVLYGTTAEQNGTNSPCHYYADNMLAANPIIKYKRAEVWQFLKDRGIPTPRYYSVPLVKEWLKNTGGNKARALRTGSYVETYYGGTTAELLEYLHQTAIFFGDDKDGKFTPQWFLSQFPFLHDRV